MNADIATTPHFLPKLIYICIAYVSLTEQLFTVAVHEMWHMLVGLVVGGEIISICIVSREISCSGRFFLPIVCLRRTYPDFRYRGSKKNEVERPLIL